MIAGQALEMCDPLSPSLRPMGEVRRQEGEKEETENGENRWGERPLSPRRLPPSCPKGIPEGSCDLGSMPPKGLLPTDSRGSL